MAVIDEIIVVEDEINKIIDSAENKTIDLIQYENKDYHFAKESETLSDVCENSVNEPIIDMNISGNSIHKLLPIEYQEVEYLQNSGTQRIDVGLIPTNSTSIDITYQSMQPTGTSQYIAGSRENASTTVEYAINGSSSNAYWDVRLNGATTTITDVNRMTNKYRSYLQLNNGVGTWTLTHTTTNTTYTKNISGAKVNATANLFLFAYNNIDANTHANLKIFACKIYESGVLVRNYVPCYRKTDNEKGFYDLVTNEFYTNSGTGSFIVGADVESTPSLEQPCEIISVGERTKNLVNIPIIDKTTGTITIPCYIDNTISFSCQEYPTLIANDSGIETSVWRIAFIRLDGSRTYAVDSALQGEGTTLTTVTADNPIVSIEYRSIYIREGAYKGIQIEYGREVTSYEPYGYKIPINICGENLANENTIQENKLIGNSANGTIIDSTTYNTLYMEVEQGRTYVFKNFARANGTTLKGCFYDSNGAWVSAFEETTVTIPSGVKYVGRSFSKEAENVQLYVVETTKSIYLNEPLRMINDVADILDYKNKKVVRNVGSIIYNGTESWSKYDSGNGYMETNDIFPDGKPVLCNIFVNSQTLIKTLSIRKNYANIYVYGVYDYYPTQAEWHSFLQENNMEVIGELVTPTEETIEVPQLLTLDGTTTIEVDTSIEPSGLSVKYWKQIEAEEIIKETPVTYGVKIALNQSNPETSVVYTDDAVGFDKSYMDFANDTFVYGSWQDKFPFNAVKPCLFKNGQVVKYLNPNDYEQDIDGNAVDITGSEGDVMIEIPKVYYKLHKDSSYQYIQISNVAQDGFCCLAHTYKGEEKDKIYIGAYQSYYDGASSRSISGIDTTGSVSLNNWRTYAQNNGAGYETFYWNSLVLLQCLYTIQFKNLNSQTALGYGIANKDLGGWMPSGTLNKKGMYYGTSTAGQVKFMGIEDLYGNKYQWIDGIYTNGKNLTVADATSPSMSFNGTGQGYITVASGISTGFTYFSKIIGDNNSGFFPQTISGSKTTYYCDYANIGTNKVLALGGSINDTDYAGMYCVSAGTATEASNYRVSRLTYCG